MKKRVILGFMIIVMLASFVLVAGQNTSESDDNLNDDADKINKAYLCLKDQIKNKQISSLQDAVFGILALGQEGKLKDKLSAEKKSNEACWPKSGCLIKDSSQALLALNRIGENSEEVKKWILSKTQNAKELTWYLEIDVQNHEASECTIRYDKSEAKVKVKEDMTLEGSVGSCFSIGYGGYWLKIDDKCVDKEFEVSCDKDFITTLVYQKANSATVFVSSETHSSVSLGTTKEKINSKCFATGTKCDYEGSLWASLALAKIGEDVGAYIPYLVALSSDNQKYLPSAFLYIVTNGQDVFNELIQNQKQGKYWDVVGSSYNRFYDSALAMLSLAGGGTGQFEATQNYLLSAQTKEGCWNNNNIRDTGFILYAGWPRDVDDRGGGGGGGKLCEDENYYCETQDNCIANGGDLKRELECKNFREVCCTMRVIEATCDEKKGVICLSNQRCTGRTESSADGTCCLEGACENLPSENLCALADGLCKSSCSDDEEESDESCPNSGDVCCMEKEEKPEESGGISTIWIVILIILIILVIIGIAYRHRLQIWWHSRRGGKAGGRPGAGGGAAGGPRPRLPPGMPMGMMPRPIPRYGPPGQRGPVRGGPALRQTKGVKSPQDKEMEETMKKLKEMSK